MEVKPKIRGSIQNFGKKIGTLAYKLALPPNLSRIQNVFHVSQLMRYLADLIHVLETNILITQENMDENLKYEEIKIRIVGAKDQVLRKKNYFIRNGPITRREKLHGKSMRVYVGVIPIFLKLNISQVSRMKLPLKRDKYERPVQKYKS